MVGSHADVAFRVLGLGVGLSTLAVLWIIGRQIWSSPPLLSLALLGFNPVVVRYGDGMRAYGFGMFFSLLTFALVARMLKDSRPRWIVAASVAAILTVQCLYQNAVSVVARDRDRDEEGGDD